MKVLLDSHVFVWALYNPGLIGKETQRLLSEADEHYVSVVSLWELGLRHKNGKLPFGISELTEGAKQLGVAILPLTIEHILEFTHIVLPHKDPFDMLLVAQATRDSCTFITSDSEVLKTTYLVRNAKT